MNLTTEAQAYLAAIITSSDDAIISKDLNGNITSWNPSAERIFGYTAEEAVGRHISLIIPAERLKEEDYILSQIKKGERIEHFETVRRTKGGSFVDLSITISPIRSSNGTIIGASKVARDISERIKIERMMKANSVKKDEFLANMSHELRTPMNAVIGLANLLQTMELPPQARKFVDTLKLSADNMMELINDLLDFAKLEANSLEFEETEFDVVEQVENAISVTSVKAQEKALSLHLNCPASFNRYYVGDPLRVHQVVMNLLSNAVKFTDKGYVEVTISGEAAAESATTMVSIKISDTGIGIAENKLETIFEKFTQADSSITRRYGGSGLGLAITKAFVKKMGGDVRVISEPGEGSTFIVTLPLKNGRKLPAEDREDTAVSPAPAHSKSVLLVEDYEPNVLVASIMLENLGCDYDVAHSGFEALSKVAGGRYHMILMDVQMPELDGLETTRRIRRMEAERGLPRAPIVAMTAHVREQDRARCLEAGMDDFIPKPFEPKELAQKVARYTVPGTT